MSLINKMLQDLDARRAQEGGGIGHTFQPASRPDRRSASTVIISITSAIAAVVLFAGAYAAWTFYQKRVPPAPPATSVTFKKAPAAVVAPAVAAPAPVAAPTPAVIQTVTPMPEGEVPEADVPAAPVQAAPAPAEPAMRAARDTVDDRPRVNEIKPQAAKKAAATPRPQSQPQPQPQSQPSTSGQAGKAVQGRTMSKQQQAEGQYHRATAALQEGRVREAIRGLEGVLVIDPRHDAARQTLVGLLIEARRGDEAMRVLQAGLVLDPRQPAMAMLLARLQIEHGGTGIDTLQRSLPYAAGDADYEGFLAGALQRASRHREAIDQYQAAVRSAPGNGVWWMGLGISLQAEKRAPEAADAYARALSTGALSPELRTFVERRLEQVRR